MDLLIIRSMLILPANVPRFLEKAHERGADAIVLDLEDAVPPNERDSARKNLAAAVPRSGSKGALVHVRVNNDPALIAEDLDAAIQPGLRAVFLPKVEHQDQIHALGEMISDLEPDRGLQPGSIKISVHVESPLGLLNIRSIANASTRIESMSLGVDDYCAELGVNPSEDAEELFYPLNVMITVCCATGVLPLGILGSVAGYKDLEGFERRAIRAKKLGSKGGYCIHPTQAPALNRIFSPEKDQIELARRIIETYERSLNEGRGSTSLDGKMLDLPVYKRAKRTMAIAEALKQRADSGY